MPRTVTSRAVRSYRTFSPLPASRRYIFCGTFHGLAPPRCYLAPRPKEPGLSSANQRFTAIAWPTPEFSGERFYSRSDTTAPHTVQHLRTSPTTVIRHASRCVAQAREQHPYCRYGSLRSALLPAIRILPSASPSLNGAAGVGAFTSEVKRSEASHEDMKAPTFAGRVASRQACRVKKLDGRVSNGIELFDKSLVNTDNDK